MYKSEREYLNYTGRRFKMDSLYKVLNHQEENHIFPFFWQHGESDEELLRELYKIQESGIRAVCVESRPHLGFGQDAWYEDMELILKECKRLGMDFWLLDDSHFPTGYANGELKKKHPELGKHAICEQHMDVMGPLTDCAVILRGRLKEDEKLLGIIACERYPGSGEKMTGRTLNLTAKVQDGIVFFDAPEGCWRVFFLYDAPHKDDYVDPMRKESVQVLIDAVYEPHYAHFKEYFGNTFKGFFSDEPFIMREAWLPSGDECRSGGKYPWNDNLRQEMEKLWGDAWVEKLPSLWFPSDNAAEVRIGYMDAVTKLYSENFCYQLGNWSRDHGVEYIGHIVEDDGCHCNFDISAGHYFRALDGQDMAGIDVVLCQIVPGMQHQRIRIPVHYITSDPDFFHFGLAKLGSSHAHIQPLKKGRAMCEIYGAYGWAEGLPMMKWLTDHMLVRGINEYVPHAFSPKYPDPDCPPHFYGAGRNPEYRGFAKVMGYMNRVSAMLSGGRHHAVCAVLYHAEAQWSGGKFMKYEKVAKVLTESQLDFDIVPKDYLEKAEVCDGLMKLADETYPVMVVPYMEIIDDGILKELNRLAEMGVPVMYIDGKPSRTVMGVDSEVLGEVVVLDKLEEAMSFYAEISAIGKNTQDLRYYHYTKGQQDIWFLTNEGIQEPVNAEITFRDHANEEYIEYDPMENKAVRKSLSMTRKLMIEPYNSLMLVFGESEAEIPAEETVRYEEADVQISDWTISFASAEEYDPAVDELSVFQGDQKTEKLYNIVREQPDYAGFVKYEAVVTAHAGGYQMDLGYVGETAAVWVNGRPVGERIIPPYRFEAELEEGENRITVVTASHLGYYHADQFSSYMSMQPVGLLGPVSFRCKQNTSVLQ